MEIMYPDIHVQLTGQDGDAIFILGKVQKALRRGKVPEAKIKEFMNEAMSGDYDHLLQTCLKWVDVT